VVAAAGAVLAGVNQLSDMEGAIGRRGDRYHRRDLGQRDQDWSHAGYATMGRCAAGRDG
jgi:hypothetical protein